MREVRGDLWDYPADARVITTNGFVKGNGCAVMGRGCAKEAAERYPDLPKLLGDRLSINGNRVHGFVMEDKEVLFTFPVKHKWYEYADKDLISRSALQLLEEIESESTNHYHLNSYIKSHIVVPRPGCGNGGLDWYYDVKPILEEVWDDRFHVITNEYSF